MGLLADPSRLDCGSQVAHVTSCPNSPITHPPLTKPKPRTPEQIAEFLARALASAGLAYRVRSVAKKKTPLKPGDDHCAGGGVPASGTGASAGGGAEAGCPTGSGRGAFGTFFWAARTAAA